MKGERIYKVLGFVEEVTTCGYCGREELKGTLALENTQDGSIGYYGSTCGAKIAQTTVKILEKELKQAELDNREAAKNEVKATPEYKAMQERREVVNKLNPKDITDFQAEWALTDTFTAALNTVIEAVKIKYKIKGYFAVN